MSNGLIYVVDAHFIDKIEKKKKISWTQVGLWSAGPDSFSVKSDLSPILAFKSPMINDNYNEDKYLHRNCIDKVCKTQGQGLLNLCVASQLRILNGRFMGIF
jgi:hypothetical protein